MMKLLCREPWSFGLSLKRASRASRESSDLGPISTSSAISVGASSVDGGQRFLELSKSVEISTVCFVT